MATIMFEKYPASRWETLFSNAFRPLFLCVGLGGLFLMGLWLLYLQGAWQAGSLRVPIISWHAHEMLFGFVGAAMGGFLLAAVSKWTGRLPVSGAPLVMLVTSWLIGRVVLLFSADIPYGVVAVVDCLYGGLLMMLVAREVVLAGNKRNYKVVVLLLLFLSFNVLFHMGVYYQPALTDLAIRGVIMQICVMIALIGGRITPSFTRNYLVLQDKERGEEGALPVLFNRLDIFASISLGLAALSWIFMPAQWVTGLLLCGAGAMQWVRVVRWQLKRILSEPLLWILHVSFIWLGAGLILLGLSSLGVVSESSGVHAIAVGAMAGMILGVASRAALGHTQRALVAGRIMSVAYVLISIAALIRTLASLTVGVSYNHLILTAGVIWLVVFSLFCIRYLPILVSPAPSWRHPGK